MTTDRSLVPAPALAACELVIERGLTTFLEVGQALTTIRDQRLYQASHATFEAYLQERWNITRGRAYQLIQAHEVHTSLECLPGYTLDGLGERTYRELAPLPPAQRRALAQQIDLQATSTRELQKLVRATKVELATRRVTPARVPRAVITPAPAGVRVDVADATKPWPVDDGSVDLIVTSPPYALDVPYLSGDVPSDDWPTFMTAWLGRAYQATKDHGRLALQIALDAGGERALAFDALNLARAVGWRYRSTIVWHDDTTSGRVATGSVGHQSSVNIIAPVEVVLLLYRGDAWNQDRYHQPTDLTAQEFADWTLGYWRIAPETRAWEQHPAAYPLALASRLVKLLSLPGDVVCDPFLGSGTTALAAWRLGRRFVGFDVVSEYVASTARRLVDADANS